MMRVARQVIRRAAVVGVLALLPALAGCSGSDLKDGPLRIRGGDAVVTMESKVGQMVAYGFNVMTNEGGSPITNLSAELVPAAEETGDGILFEPAVVVDITALDTGYLGAGSWPAKEWSNHAKPLQGFEMTAASDGQVELFLVAKVTKDGQWLWPRTKVEYDYAGSHYAEEVTNGFAVCAPAPCTPPTSATASGS